MEKVSEEIWWSQYSALSYDQGGYDHGGQEGVALPANAVQMDVVLGSLDFHPSPEKPEESSPLGVNTG